MLTSPLEWGLTWHIFRDRFRKHSHNPFIPVHNPYLYCLLVVREVIPTVIIYRACDKRCDSFMSLYAVWVFLANNALHIKAINQDKQFSGRIVNATAYVGEPVLCNAFKWYSSQSNQDLSHTLQIFLLPYHQTTLGDNKLDNSTGC